MVSRFFSRLFILLVSALAIASCGGGGDGSDGSDGSDNSDNTNPSTPTVETFSVSFTQESISIESGKSQAVDYTFTREGSNNFDIEVSIASEPSVGTVTLDKNNNRLTYSSDTAGSGSFSLQFKSASLQINKQLLYNVTAPAVVEPEPDKPVIKNDQDFIIYLPSDYITIYEGESITLELKRNYEMHEQIIEEFYFNTDNIRGRVSDDKTKITLTALDSDEDTYGEVTAVTKVNGILHETKMYLIYYNKNRDLDTTKPPVVALLEHEILITPFATTVKSFDVYDPDSDRISYRILSSPTFANTHLMKVADGYELTIQAIGKIDPVNNDLVLQVSDSKNTDIHIFNLIEKTTTATGQKIKTTSASANNNRPPRLAIEENVTISLIKEFTGNEKGQIAELAFAHSDPDGDTVTLSAKASVNGRYTFNIQPPYLYVSANDISDLQYDQITLIASDGKYESKMTFHFYVKNNFLTFRGGNPNTPPMTDLPKTLKLQEGIKHEIPFNSYDHEKHPFDVGIQPGSSVIQNLIRDSKIVLTDANLVFDKLTAPIQTSLTVWLEDVFESRREHTITLEVVKNTPPVITLDFVATNEVDKAPYVIKEVEQTPVQIKVTVTDPDEGNIQPQFEFNSNFISVNYIGNIATINSTDLTADYKGQIKVKATDNAGAVSEQLIDVEYKFRDPKNKFPEIKIEPDTFEVQPGGKGTTIVTITDAENDPLQITSKASSDDITYTYNTVTGKLDFTVSKTAKFEQELLITITASDGRGLSQKNVVVKIPKSPTDPVLTVDFFQNKVPEKVPFNVTFGATDVNNEIITMNTEIPSSDIKVKVVAIQNVAGLYRGRLEITPPPNVLSEKTYNFTLIATDASGKTDKKLVSFTVQPVNDPPQLSFVVLDGVKAGESGEIILANNTSVNLKYGIKDPDTTGQKIEVIYPVKKGRYKNFSAVEQDYTYFIESFVTTADNKIRVNGDSKRGTYGYVSANKGSSAVNGDTFKDKIKVQVQEPISTGSVSNHGDDLEVNVTIKFVNNKPVVGSFDLIQLLENRNQTINLAITDGDIANRSAVKQGEEQICIIVNNSSSLLQLYDVRPSTPELIKLGQKYCDTDARGPLTQLRINTLAVSSNQKEFFTLNVNDGFENVTQIINVEILNN